MSKARSAYRVLIVLLCLISLFLPPGKTWARPAKRDALSLKVRLIEASSPNSQQKKKIPRNLEDLKDDLSTLPYGEFKQVNNSSLRSPIGKTASVGLSHGLKLDITPVKTDGEMHSLSIKLTDGSDQVLLNMTIRTRSGSYTLIGGPKVGEKDVVILAISAE